MSILKSAWLTTLVSVALFATLVWQSDASTSRTSYLFTVSAGYVACLIAFYGWYRARNKGLIIAEAMFLHVGVFLLLETTEEMGWGLSQWGMHIPWFRSGLSDGLKIMSSCTVLSLAMYGLLWARGYALAQIWVRLRWVWIGTLFAALTLVLLVH